MRTVGAYEANTTLSRLLEAVEAGETISITRHGREVAKLVPAREQPLHSEVVTALRAARTGVRRSGTSLRRLIEAGRR
ncbi:type II toxin-antitoxin system Phd/YefM family antitoxin [Nakamurella deserti]|uniref:type II toxin-antitoxin system Phd/YefM family antitoxin n=1 Tax=Nakamurella deserti TaxID=2164074 RepID=UPI000DBE28FB|nr:type II toxin-antitoxin system prevent-host-death family antitoxin [Nakamurella deserti]